MIALQFKFSKKNADFHIYKKNKVRPGFEPYISSASEKAPEQCRVAKKNTFNF